MFARSLTVLAGICSCAIAFPAAARPDCSYATTTGKKPTPSAGIGTKFEWGRVTCKVGTRDQASDVSVLRVDMTTKGRFLSATPAPRIPPKPDDNPNGFTGSIFALGLPTTSLMKSRKYGPVRPYVVIRQAAVNANFFTNYPRYSRKSMRTTATWLQGLLIAGGVVYNAAGANASFNCPPQSDSCAPFDATLAFDASGRASIRRIDAAAARGLPANGARRIVTAVTGSIMLLADGVDVAPGPGSGTCGRSSRTAAGLTAGGRWLILVAVDSSGDINGDASSDCSGIQVDQLAALMADLGARDAINLDGGGSTTMALRSGNAVSIVNRPRDNASPCDYRANGGCERYVGNVLVVGVVRFRPHHAK